MSLLYFLFGFWQFFLVWALGICIERFFRFSLPYGYRMAVAFGMGEAACSIGLFLLGLVGGLRLEVFSVLLILGTIFLFQFIIQEFPLIVSRSISHIKVFSLSFVYFLYLIDNLLSWDSCP
jgi:hypothetical protein